MTLTRIKLDRFTAFEKLDVELSPGINIFVGENGTGKTHLLKVGYAACDITKSQDDFAAKLIRTFLPYERRLGRLVHRTGKSTRAVVQVWRGENRIRLSFSNHAKEARNGKLTGADAWLAEPVESAFIPVKEVLANAPGFRSLYAAREVEFEELYADIVDRAFRPILRGPHDQQRRSLLRILGRDIEGKVVQKNEHFFLKNKQGELEFSLLAEGTRKLALLWLLVQNGTLLDGAVLFWDEPEANLNPKKMRRLVNILLELQRMGVQILLATHDYVLLKEFDLAITSGDRVLFHALYRNGDGRIAHKAAKEFLDIDPNAITDTFTDLYRREIGRSLGAS